MTATILRTRALRVLSLVFLLFSYEAMAWDACRVIFSTSYPDSQTEDLAGCQTCHTTSGGGPFNRYGQDLLDNGASGAGFSCDAVDFGQALINVNSFDSDGVGGTNEVEIAASTQPGWCDTSLNSGCVNPTGTPPNVALDPAPANNPPVAVVGGPYVGEAGTAPVQFDGSSSNDPDGDMLSYAWQFGDGNSGTGVSPSHTYTAAGNFEVRLIVNDGLDDSAPSITTATITAPPVNLAPVAQPGGPYSGQPGAAVTFDGSASSDPNGDTITYLWDFGDGAMGDGVSPSHIYAAEGIYTVSLTVNDGRLDSQISTTTADIAVPPANRAPTADAGGPYTATTDSAVVLDGSASTDPDGDSLTFSWDFGDGALGDGPTPSHTYTSAGTYAVSLVVNDGELESDVVTSTVVVRDPDEQSDGQVLYDAQCLACHGDPWTGPAVDDGLPGLRRVGGSRSCNIDGSIFGTSVFPNGVPEMQHLQGLTNPDIDALADYLNSADTSGERRYVATCAGCHGNDASGGRVDEDVYGESASETWEAIAEESEMHYLACMPREDIDLIADFLRDLDVDHDDDGIHDDDDDDDDNDGRSDEEEREDGTDPHDSDTDDDGLNDGEEHEHGCDPLDRDTDDDGKTDGYEVKVAGTNPLVADAPSAASTSGGGSPSPYLLALLAIAALRRGRRS